MANTVIQLKHSTLTGNVPSSLANGEISINSRDGKFFYSTPAGVVVTHYPYPGPAGLNQEIQFNDSGVLGSDSGLTYNKTTDVLTVVGGAIIGGVNVTPQIQLAFTQANTPSHVANSAASYANSAFAKANNEGGVNTTQNTNITNAGTYANAAFTRANNSLNSNTGGTVTANTTFSGNVFLTGNGTTLSVTSNLSFISPNTQNTITARMINGGTLSFSSNSGELFSITDSLAQGSIFSVNDISGLPVIDVDANGWISFAQFGGNVHVYNAATSVSNSTGALVVDGGVGVKGNVYADAIYDGGIEIIAYANTAFLAANTPSHVANSAASYANSAFIHANAAFNQANTGGGGGTTDFGFGIIYTANNNTFANATTANAQVNFVGENGTVVYANATTKTITFAGTPGAQGLTVDYGFVNDPIYYSIDYGSLA